MLQQTGDYASVYSDREVAPQSHLAGNKPQKTIAHAEGGDWMVTQPSSFLAGEARVERATFTPISKGSKYNTEALLIALGKKIEDNALDENKLARMIRDVVLLAVS